MNYKKGIRIFVIILIVLAVVAVVVLYNVYQAKENPEAAFANSEQVDADRAALDEDHVSYAENDNGIIDINGKRYAPKENVVNILLLGIDSDAEREKANMGWRSDMIMLCTIDFDTDQISFTSIPRDSRAMVSHVDKSTGKITSEALDKLNAAYAYGGGPSYYSAENAMRCTSLMLECDGLVNVPINYYISIDLGGLPKLADALDGIEVTLDQDFPDLGSKGDTIDLKGDKVRKYLENRKQMADGETDRQRHEQEFMKAMARKIKSMGAVDSASALLDTFLNFGKTNLNLNQILSFAAVLDKTSIDSMNFRLLEEGHPEVIDGIWFYIPHQDEMLPLMLELLYNPA
ncbi:MAG: LCP family protein [Christensenellaceae bacterium]